MSELTFHPFQRLPFEIRTAIFYYALQPLPEGQIISVHVEIDPTSPFDRHEHDSRGRFPTQSKFARFFNPDAVKPPGLSLLWTSVESRTVASSYYSFTCADTGTTTAPPPPAETSPLDGTASSMDVDHQPLPARIPRLTNPGILFRPDQDIIHLKSRHGIAALSYARSSELRLSDIRVLALDLYLWKHYLISRQLFEGWAEDAPFLAGLERLVVVLDTDQGSMIGTDARSIGGPAAVEELRGEVERKLAGLERLRRGIEVRVVHRNELTMEKMGSIFSGSSYL